MSRRRGYSLLEAVIAVTLLGIFFGGVGLLSARTSDAYQEGSAAAELDARVGRALSEIARELEDSGRGELVPEPLAPLGAEALDFRAVADLVGGVTWSPTRRIAWEREPGENDDGVDEDGDGLVDEGRVVWIENPGQPDERRRVLIGGVPELDFGETANNLDDDGDGLIDERGLAFVVEGDVLGVRLTAQDGRDGGRVLVRSAATSVHLRN